MTYASQFWLLYALKGWSIYIIHVVASCYGKCQHHTWQFDWLREVIEVKFWKDTKPVVVFQEDQFWLFIITSISLKGYREWLASTQSLFLSQKLSREFCASAAFQTLICLVWYVAILLTRMFLSATKTLGAETTPIVMSFVASLRSSVANLLAVSSEYYMWGGCSFSIS